tara:strand:- start:1053 stop:1862 length:810 start_codon:yes stop_codon:yes gene_type:complete
MAINEKEEELLAIFLWFASRIEARIEREVRPVLRLAMLELREIVSNISPGGQFRIYEWQEIQARALPILSKITSVLRIQIPPELEEIRPKIQKAAAKYVDQEAPDIVPIGNQEILRKVVIGGITLNEILGSPGVSNRLTINMAKDLDRMVRTSLFMELPTNEIANKVVRVIEKNGRVVSQIRRGSYANQILNRTNNTISAAVWDVTNKTAREFWEDIAIPNQRWMWLATLENTCPVCLPFHRVVKSRLSEFTALPAVHPNCRCVVVPVI